MIVYVNGDSHSAGAEAVNTHCFANDDPLYRGLGRQAHPDNIKVSYGCNIANHYHAILECDAESASSNDRIIRTTRQYLEEGNQPDLIIIGWATWEREEWLHNGQYYQVSAGGFDTVPPELHTRYKQWVIEKSHTYAQDELSCFEKIKQLHIELLDLNIPHLFFNTYMHFGHVALNHQIMYNWHNNYIDPYNQNGTYYYWLRNQGFKCVQHHDVHESYHYGADAHRAWSEYLIPHVEHIIRQR
jgi:hypothetical protein